MEEEFRGDPLIWSLLESSGELADKDVTDTLIVGPPGSNKVGESQQSESHTPPRDPRDLFVVHGRNGRARDALFPFLRAIGLRPLEWDEAIRATRKPTPYIGEILDAAFSQAHAVVVLFTPDDEARLKSQFCSESDPEYEICLTGQARPNVLFEAGMAMGRNAEQTVLVELGQLRPFSDISGLHVVRLDDDIQTWKELANRLETAGCPVNWDGIDWQNAGDFEAVVSSIVLGQTGTVAEATQQSELEGKRKYTDRTAEEITLEVPFGEDFISPEIGKWLRVDEKAWYAPITTIDPIEITIGETFHQVSLHFDNTKWRSRLASIKEGSRIVAEGRIVKVEPLGLSLHDCELLDVVE